MLSYLSSGTRLNRIKSIFAYISEIKVEMAVTYIGKRCLESCSQCLKVIKIIEVAAVPNNYHYMYVQFCKYNT